ncbi:MAG: murein biosynthesis integral membrane protein MurJ [Rickettsiales bacterium]|jgi:putative peptidoglycan lipid II flippase|nr:murein biosynthesis integral membrane protein MurJ [Rickettsiales bacterium]
MSLARKIFDVGLWTGVSRVLGFVRDMLVGRYLGAGRLSDIFLAAFKLPNLFRDLLGEGALSSVFIPLFSKEKKSESFASNAFSWLMSALLVITVLVEIFMPLVILGFAPGFDAEKMRMTVEIARVMFFYVILVCGVGFLSAVLNAFSDFAAAAFIPVLLNVFLIAGLLAFGADLHALAFSVLAAGVVQFAILYARLRRRNFGIRLIRPRLTPLLRSLVGRMGWGFIGSGFYQLNIIVGVLLASYQSGAVSYLYYADRMVQLPFAIIGLAAGTVILTKISDAISAKRMGIVHQYQNAAMRQSMMLTLPCMAGLFSLAEPIIRILFEHGEWTHGATIAVATAIMAQVFSLPFMTTSQIYLKTLYASGDARTPVKISAISLAIGVAVMLALVRHIGYLCVPFGTVVSGIVRNRWMYMVCLRRGLFAMRKKTMIANWAFLALSAAMGVGLWFAKPLAGDILALGIIMALSAIIYLPIAFFCDKIIGK